MAVEKTPDYVSTMSELYSIGETIFDNLAGNLTPFTDYKAKYTVDFITELRAQRVAAMELPDEEERNAIFKTRRIDLIELAKTCCKNYQMLKGYIKDSFVEEQHTTQWDAAGQRVYLPATNKSWENVVTLNTRMGLFITANATKLANNLTGAVNMPGTFPTKVAADKTAFNTKYAELKRARQTGVDTASKIALNNVLYKNIVDVNEDAQVVFDDAEHLKLFSFSAVKAIVSPPGSASFKVTVKKHADDTVLEGATVTIKHTGDVALTAVTNAQGVAEFANIDPAGYSVKITMAGYEPETFTKEVNTGTAARSEVFMEVVTA